MGTQELFAPEAWDIIQRIAARGHTVCVECYGIQLNVEVRRDRDGCPFVSTGKYLDDGKAFTIADMQRFFNDVIEEDEHDDN